MHSWKTTCTGQLSIGKIVKDSFPFLIHKSLIKLLNQLNLISHLDNETVGKQTK